MHLSTRITLSILLVSTILIALFGALSVNAERVALQTILHKQGNVIAQSIAAYSVEMLVAADYPALEMALNTIGHESDEIVLIQISKNGHIVARYGNVSTDKVLTSTADVVLYNTSSGEQKLGEIKLLVSERNNDAVIATHIKNMLIYMLLFLVVFSLALRYLLGRLLVKRIQLLTSMTEQLIAAELPARVGQPSRYKDSQDEIEVLHEHISNLLARLQSSDAARTPDESARSLR